MVSQVGHSLTLPPVFWIQLPRQTTRNIHEATPCVKHDVLHKRCCIPTHSTKLFGSHGQHDPCKMVAGFFCELAVMFSIVLSWQAKGVPDSAFGVVPFLADTANAVQPDGYMTIRFRNAISG